MSAYPALVCGLLVLCVPVVQAQDGLLLGTEDDPELLESGPEQYWIGYVGERNHDYLQLLAGWFGFDNVTNEVIWTLKVKGGAAYTQARSDWILVCSLEGNLTVDGHVAGQLTSTWRLLANGTERTGVNFTTPESTGSSQQEGFPHRFEARVGSPSYFEFRVERGLLLKWGKQIQDLQARCYESYYPHPQYGILVSGVAQNGAATKSQAVFSFEELRRVRGPDGSPDDLESLNKSLSPIAASTSDEPARSAGFVGMALLTALASAVAFNARRGKK